MIPLENSRYNYFIVYIFIIHIIECIHFYTTIKIYNILYRKIILYVIVPTLKFEYQTLTDNKLLIF